MSRRGFSLVELLVVIGIIACLVGILLPVLSAAREHAKRVACISNVRQLTIAWLMYANDNRGRLCSSNSWENDGSHDPVPGPRSFSWIGGGTDPSQGALWPYLHDARIYFCPNRAGPRGVHIQPPFIRDDYISYAMNGLLASQQVPPGLPRSALLITDIKHAESTFVFIEPFNTVPCDRYVPPIYTPGVSAAEGFDWPPGRNHWLGGANGTTLSFADGHAIFWQYANLTTYNPYDNFGAANTGDSLQLAAWSGFQNPRGANSW